MKEANYHYYAFISYNHRDEKAAKWLQSRLEHYRLPSVARKEIGEDVKIRPVFRYVSDLGVAVLREKIKEELDASKYLIVVCSPYSAKPNVKGEHWVNDEVKRFISLGRKDRIVPVIDGAAGGKMEYDARGREVRRTYFGVDGKPTLHRNGYAEIRCAYKQDGTVATAEFLDVSGNKITLRQVVVSVEVTPNLAAEKAGVKKGDVWCRLGTYDILKSENVYEVVAVMQAVRNAEKELVVARKVGDAYEIHSFKFPVGIMGIRVNEQDIPDFDKLAQAYKAYCEKGKQEGEEK